MPWQVIVDAERHIVETRYSGLLTAPDLDAAVRETAAVAQAHKCHRLLGDCTKLVGGHTVADLYLLADMLAASPLRTEIKEAVLMPDLEAAAADVQFWEDVCSNRGLRVRTFKDRQSAIDWLCA